MKTILAAALLAFLLAGCAGQGGAAPGETDKSAVAAIADQVFLATSHEARYARYCLIAVGFADQMAYRVRTEDAQDVAAALGLVMVARARIAQFRGAESDLMYWTNVELYDAATELAAAVVDGNKRRVLSLVAGIFDPGRILGSVIRGGRIDALVADLRNIWAALKPGEANRDEIFEVCERRMAKAQTTLSVIAGMPLP